MTELDQSVLHALLDLTDAGSATDPTATLLDRLTHQAVALLPAACCAVAVAGEDGELSLLRCSSGDAWPLALVQLECRSGPLVDCFRLGVAVQCADIGTADQWPELAEAARALGIRAFSAVPLRRRGQVLGAACMMRARPGLDSPEVHALALALADSTAIGLLRAEAARHDGRTVDLWRDALARRITIDQASGIVAQRRGISVDAAALLIERQATAEGVDTGEFAHRVVRGMARWDPARG
ncbi:MAG TPA: GAF and ANTAR domain-containing protein [Actinospica sp.]|jgi:GAF domain-containing protein|nr:GAF and ANTAR domain-containing protein [Actinospica sp.]